MKRSPLKRGRRKPKRTPEQADHYTELRYQAASRSYGACEADGMHSSNCLGVGSQAHHILPVSRGGADVLANLLWVHVDCHARIHSHPNASKEMGYLQ